MYTLGEGNEQTSDVAMLHYKLADTTWYKVDYKKCDRYIDIESKANKSGGQTVYEY